MLWRIRSRVLRPLAFLATGTAAFAGVWGLLEFLSWSARSEGWQLGGFVAALLATIGILVLGTGSVVLLTPPGPEPTPVETRVNELMTSLRSSLTTIEEIEQLLADRSARALEAKAELERLRALGQVEEDSAAAIVELMTDRNRSATRRARVDAIVINAVFLGLGIGIGFVTRGG